jgi:hypothetical protein
MALTLTAIGTARSHAEDAYELTIIPAATGGGPSVFRINVATGQVSLLSGSNFTSIPDPQAIPAGKYRLYYTQAPDNKTFWLYRLEALTGRIWFDSTNWNEIQSAASSP